MSYGKRKLVVKTLTQKDIVIGSIMISTKLSLFYELTATQYGFPSGKEYNVGIYVIKYLQEIA